MLAELRGDVAMVDDHLLPLAEQHTHTDAAREGRRQRDQDVDDAQDEIEDGELATSHGPAAPVGVRSCCVSAPMKCGRICRLNVSLIAGIRRSWKSRQTSSCSRYG